MPTTVAEPASPTPVPLPLRETITETGQYLLDIEAGTLSRTSDRVYGVPEAERRYVDVRSSGKTLLRDRVTGREFEAPAEIVPLGSPITRESSLADGAATLANEGLALIGREAGDPETCRVVRYDPDGAILSDASFGCALAWDGPYLSPDGNLIAANVLPKAVPDGPGFYEMLTAVAVFDAATGEELFRIRSAFWFSGNHLARSPETVWLPDSSGFVVTTARGNRIVTAEGEWAPLPATLRETGFVASPTAPLRFLLRHYGPQGAVAVLDEDGGLVATVGAEVKRSPEEHPDSFLAVSPWWGTTSQEVHVAVWFQGPTSFIVLIAVLPPALERAPIEERLFVRVAADGSCVDVLEEPVPDSPSVTCLEDGSIVETVESKHGTHTATTFSECPTWTCTWIYVRTEDGAEGWALSDHLRWAKGEPPPDSGG